MPTLPPPSPVDARAAAAAASLAWRWALVSLAATLITGVWLRLAMLQPALFFGANVGHAIHAHSHVAFFGWLVPAAAALAVRRGGLAASALQRWRVLLHGLGVLSLVALVLFLQMGYRAPTIALSAVHVVGWVALARMLWPMRAATVVARRWWRAALGALVASGAVTVVPAMLVARGIHDGWWRDVTIKLFLSLFLTGFAGLGAMATLVDTHRTDDLRWARRVVLVAMAPLAVLYVAAAPPWPWLTAVGRGAVGAVGVATLAVVWASRGAVRRATRVIPVGAMAVVGTLELLAAGGVGASLMHGRAITVAFTHLVLLVWVTPLLAEALQPGEAFGVRRVARVTAAAAGAVMCGALAVLGWPAAREALASLGATPSRLAMAAAIGGVGAAIGWLAGLGPTLGAGAPEVGDDVPARGPDDSRRADAGGALPPVRDDSRRPAAPPAAVAAAP